MRCALSYRMPIAQLIVRIGPVTLKQKEAYYQRHREQWPKAKPKKKTVSALIDTGASVTIIEKSIVDELELPAHGYCPICGFDSRTENGDGPKKYPNYEVGLSIVDSDGENPLLTIRTGQAVGHSLGNTRFDAIIGMDVLHHCNFSVYGPDDSYELTAPVASVDEICSVTPPTPN